MDVIVYVVTVVEDNKVTEQQVFFNLPLAQKSFELFKTIRPDASTCIASRRVITEE